MQTKSEMINQIAELAKENAELKQEVKQLHNGRNPEELYTLFGKPIKYWEELKAENEQLKEEIKEVKKYQYQQEYLDKEIKEMQKALKTLAEGLNKRQILLQEIKAIAETCCSEINCEECPFTDECNTEMEALGVCKMILNLITKAEEE